MAVTKTADSHLGINSSKRDDKPIVELKEYGRGLGQDVLGLLQTRIKERRLPE